MITNKKPDITLVLPTYNERDNIKDVILNSIKALNTMNRTWEIIIIDNFSCDDTPSVVRGIIKDKNLQIRLIIHNENKLYSGSCRTAIKEAQGKYIAIMDSDGQFVATDIPKFLKKLESGSNLVFGWRRKRNDSFVRLIMSDIFNFIGKFWLGFKLHDLNVGIRMFDRQFAEIAEIKYAINMSNPELYVRAKKNNLKINEIEIEHHKRTKGKTSHNFFKIGVIFFRVNKYMALLRREMKY